MPCTKAYKEQHQHQGGDNEYSYCNLYQQADKRRGARWASCSLSPVFILFLRNRFQNISKILV